MNVWKLDKIGSILMFNETILFGYVAGLQPPTIVGLDKDSMSEQTYVSCEPLTVPSTVDEEYYIVKSG